MSEIRLIVRDSECDWSGTVHASVADRAIAALSANPVTLAELAAACTRYERRNPSHALLAGLRRGLDAEPHDAGIAIIDLVGRLVIVDSTYSSPGPAGEVSYHDGDSCTNIRLRYHLADDWKVAWDFCQWKALTEQRRHERAAHPPLDVRAVLFGHPMLEFIARRAFDACARHLPSPADVTGEPVLSAMRPADAGAVAEIVHEIHAAWMLTPCAALDGACPRDVAIEQRSHLDQDLQDQSHRWSVFDERPPELDQRSFAFRFGGFGTHELVLYYGLVRELLWSCIAELTELSRTRPLKGSAEALTPADFLTSEIARLERIRDEWFERPDPDCHMRTPRSIIARERARIPEAISAREAIIDPDCPCCQMMADLPGPVFWHLDGSEMDDDFAFDMSHRTREEWERERDEWDARRASLDTEPRSDSVWSSSYVGDGRADAPLEVRLFGISARLAELVADLQSRIDEHASTSDAGQLVDRLNRDFGNVCDLLRSADRRRAEAIIRPAIDRLVESLEDTASLRPDLRAKCVSLMDTIEVALPGEPAFDPETPF